ncbi:MAG: EVE domain-containing protein [Thaumarchaeota archaeon]|nr:EVE domain-containing protein [Nitrososphaerota archaeon]
MMFLGENDDDMKFFGKSKIKCSNICHHYSANKTVTSQGVVDQYKCDVCSKYIFPGGIQSSQGVKKCRCCGGNLIYIRTISDDSELPEKKTISHSFTRETYGMKTFSQFSDFLENEIHLQANYQLVVLKFMAGHKMSTKYEIAEELAYCNNKNFNDVQVVKDFCRVPVFDVLENRGFIKKINHDGDDQYVLNIQLNNLESDRVIEILEKKLNEYNLEHDIPENQYDDVLNPGNVVKDDTSTVISKTSEPVETDSNQTLQNFWIWSTNPKNWEIINQKHVWGSRIPPDRISNRVKEGDLVAFYVIGTNSFKGVFEFASDWFDSPGETWADDLEPNGKLRYVSQIKLLPLTIGLAELGKLYEKMNFFKDKPTNIRNLILQGNNGYPSNNSKSLIESDFEEIINELKNHPEPIDDSQIQPVSKNETITVIENSSAGIVLKEFTEIKSEEIHKSQILSNDDLMKNFGVGNMGGIRHSKKNNLLVLCSSLSNDYADSLDSKSGLHVYSGEGQTGDQELIKGNKKILDSECKMLLFKEKYQEPGVRKRGALDNLYEFVGPVNYVKHFWVDEKDKEGNIRKAVKFVLEVEE